MSANTLKVKRSATFSSTSNPSSLSYGELAFNNGGSTGINNWDTSSCTNMASMFHQCTGFNPRHP